MSTLINTVLRSSPLLSGLKEQSLIDVQSLSEVISLEDGQRLFSPGEPASQFFVVLEGKIAIRAEESQHQMDIARFVAGDSFGELDFFMGGERNALAVATGKCQVLGFPKTKTSLPKLSGQWPSVMVSLVYSFLVHISARIRGANALLKSNTPLVRELRRQVYVDKLTGLHNQIYFREILQEKLKQGTPVGLLMYKPDNFKQVNDEFGHESGDALLKHIAEALCQVVPEEGMLFRYTGNENAIIFPNISRKKLKEHAETIGLFLRNLDLTQVLSDTKYSLSISIGLALAPEHGTQIDVLIETAHLLTLEGRSRGGNFILFPEESNTQ